MTTVASAPAYMLPGVPVVHPPHLEGDPALATEILPGPPSLQSVQQAANRKDTKKPTSLVSYLPVSDPGSTYAGLAMAGGLAAPIDPDEPRRKRARADRSMSRAQRASARSLNAAPAPLLSPPPGDEPVASSSHVADATAEPNGIPPLPDDERPAPSRTNSDMNAEDLDAGSSSARNRGARNKGKAKEKVPIVRVKEEPVTMSLSMLDNVILRQPNEDHCSSCRTVASGGGLVYCDSCPRAFHFVCLDPPIDPSDVGDGDWFCPSCIIRQNPPPRHERTFMGSLIQQVQSSFPVEYRLPDEIRGFFKDVGSDPRGAYVDTSQLKPPRLDRHGRPEERDPYRLKDRNGVPIICFQCGKSALPADDSLTPAASKRPRRAATVKSVNSESGRSLLSCDYCDLHWHLDCMDPPVAVVPTSGKRWMCPAHNEQILPPKRRIPKQHNTPIEVAKLNQKNNGNIEIVQSETPAVTKVATEDVIINGRRYRIPERVITLDFWTKLSRVQAVRNDLMNDDSLSELSVLSEDEDGELDAGSELAKPSLEELNAAMALCNISRHMSDAGITRIAVPTIPRRMVSIGIQASPPQPDSLTTARIAKNLPNGKYAPAASAVTEDAKPAKPIPASKRPETGRAAANNIHLDSSISSVSSTSTSGQKKHPVPTLTEKSLPTTLATAALASTATAKAKGRSKKTAAATATRLANQRARSKASEVDNVDVDAKAPMLRPGGWSQALKAPKVKLSAPTSTAAGPSTSMSTGPPASGVAPPTTTAAAGASNASEAHRSSSVLKIRLPRLSGLGSSSPSKPATSVSASDAMPTASPSSAAQPANEQANGSLPTPSVSATGRPRRAARGANASTRNGVSASASARRSGRAKRGAPSATPASGPSPVDIPLEAPAESASTLPRNLVRLGGGRWTGVPVESFPAWRHNG